MLFAPKCLLIQHFNCLDYISFNINLSLLWISLLGIFGNLVTISLLYKSLCAGRLFINKQFTGVHLWGVLSVELPPSTDPRGRPIAKGAQSTSWCHCCVCGPMSLFCLLWRCDFIISWRRMAVIFWFNSWWSIRVDPCSIY